jgi:hypothetical protein
MDARVARFGLREAAAANARIRTVSADQHVGFGRRLVTELRDHAGRSPS